MKEKAYSISVANDDHAEEHSRRSYTPASAERSLSQSNIIIYDCGDDRRAFNAFFEDAILAYNSRQKRADRKKRLDYLSALEDGTEGYGKGKQKEKAFYHSVIQVGNRDTLGVTDAEFDADYWKALKRAHKWHEAEQYVKKHLNRSEDREQMTAVLKEVGERLQEKYPYIKVWGCVIHRDEPNGTDHMDLRFSIFTDGEKTGLSKRISMNKGLAKMGFRTDKEKTALQKFQDAIKRDVEDAMERRGYSRQFMSNMEKHLSTSMFQVQKDKEKAIKAKEALERQNGHVSGEIVKLTELRDQYETEVINMLDEKKGLEQDLDILRKRNAELEAELAGKRDEKETLDRDLSEKRSRAELLEERAAELRKFETNLDKKQRSIEEFFYQNKRMEERMLEILGDKREYRTEQERQDALEKAFQGWEDRLEAQMRARIDEALSGLMDKYKEYEKMTQDVQEKKKLYEQGIAIYQELTNEKRSESLMEYLKKKKYTVPKVTTEQVMKKDMSGWETKTRYVKNDKGKIVWEQRNPLQDYMESIKGKNRSRELTEDEKAILKLVEQMETEVQEAQMEGKAG